MRNIFTALPPTHSRLSVFIFRRINSKELLDTGAPAALYLFAILLFSE